MSSGANLSIVVNNIPDKATVGDIAKFCSKAGVLAMHPVTGEPLILYNYRTHRATVTYGYPEGANCAIDLLSNECFMDGIRVQVERAVREPMNFGLWKQEMRSQRKYHSHLSIEDETIKKKDEKRLKIMVLKGVFELKELLQNDSLYETLLKDFNEICAQYGTVKFVKVIDNNQNGVVIVSFEDSAAASKAVGSLDGSEYRGRNITSELWDGTDLAERKNPPITS